MAKRWTTIILLAGFITIVCTTLSFANKVSKREDETRFRGSYDSAATAMYLTEKDIRDRRLSPIRLKGVVLKGTAISGIFKPIAIVEDTRTHESRWYMVGDTLCGARVVEIRRGAVVLEMRNRLYLFGLPEGEIKSKNFDLMQKENITLGTRTGDYTWKVKLDEVIETISRITQIMKEARIRPYFAIGKPAGVYIDRIKEGSLIEEMGFRNGDIIKGVNGFGILSPTKIFEAYRKYKNERLIQVQVIRDEKPLTLTYNIVR